MFFGSSKKKILVIDDDESLQRQVEFRLKRHENAKVIQAIDGTHGVEMAKKKLPDLIILDWMLPDISGPEVLIKLKACENTSNIPVLMLTGKSKIGDIEDAFELGAEGYLTKPFSLSNLGSKVQDILNSVPTP
ncbi:MAG: two-component system response regulator [Moraxellaceae bacterium]|nr:MAG: two-component system response regulator [Moraxellaceae bacterium]